MCTTTHQPLLSLLRRVCVQLSDLAANSAIMIARGVLDIVYDALVPKEENKPILCTGHTVRLLNFLACLMTHATIKCAVLQLFNSNSNSAIKGDEKYPNIVQFFTQILKTNCTVPSHVQSQECILSIIQSFCDTEITLLQNLVDGSSHVSSEVFLANALPTKDHLVLFISIITDHIMADENSFVTFLPIVRTYLLLMEHDYGFGLLRDHLLKRTDPLLNILNKLEKTYSKDSAEYMSLLNTLLEFLRLCMNLDEVDETVLYKPRFCKMTADEVKSLIGLKGIEAAQKHPLYLIEQHLKVIIL